MSITVERVIGTQTNHYEFGEWKEICEEYEKATQISCKVSLDEFPIYKEGDIIDENQTVIWNREEVIKRNKAREDAIKKKKRIRDFAIENIECVIINLTAVELMKRDIVENGDIGRAVEKAILIYDKAWKYHYPYTEITTQYGMYKVCLYINDLIGFIEEFIA